MMHFSISSSTSTARYDDRDGPRFEGPSTYSLSAGLQQLARSSDVLIGCHLHRHRFLSTVYHGWLKHPFNRQVRCAAPRYRATGEALRG